MKVFFSKKVRVFVLIHEIQVDRHLAVADDQLDAPVVDGAGASHGPQP